MRGKREKKIWKYERGLPRAFLSPPGSGAGSQNPQGMIQVCSVLQRSERGLVPVPSDWTDSPFWPHSSPGYGQPSGISDTPFASAFSWGDAALHCSLVTPETPHYSFTCLCAGSREKQNSTSSTTLRINTWHDCQLTLYSPFHPYPVSTPTYFPFLLSKLHFSSVLLFFMLCVL